MATPTPTQPTRPQAPGKAPETETKMPQQPPMGTAPVADPAIAQVQGELRALTQRMDAMEQRLAQVTGHPEIAKLMQPQAGPGQPLQPGQAGTPQQTNPVTALG